MLLHRTYLRPLALTSLASLAALSALVTLTSTGCDGKEAPKGEAAAKDSPSSAAATSAAAPTPTTPAVPPGPTKPQLAVDDTAAFVSGERVDFAAPDAKGRIVAAIGDKPVAGEVVVLNAARDAKLPRVTTVFAALVAKKAKGVEVHTPRRDRTEAVVVFTTSTKPADCSAVGYIAKDGAISVWPASGATAERFSRGMAGPDLTRGSEGLKKRLLACDAPVWFLSADESVTWGLLFDLELAATGNEDGGVPLTKPRSVALLTKTAVPGRKVEVETVE